MGFYYEASRCNQCRVSCRHCTSLNNCLLCQKGFVLVQGQCQGVGVERCAAEWDKGVDCSAQACRNGTVVFDSDCEMCRQDCEIRVSLDSFGSVLTLTAPQVFFLAKKEVAGEQYSVTAHGHTLQVSFFRPRSQVVFMLPLSYIDFTTCRLDERPIFALPRQRPAVSTDQTMTPAHKIIYTSLMVVDVILEQFCTIFFTFFQQTTLYQFAYVLLPESSFLFRAVNRLIMVKKRLE